MGNGIHRKKQKTITFLDHAKHIHRLILRNMKSKHKTELRADIHKFRNFKIYITFLRNRYCSPSWPELRMHFSKLQLSNLTVISITAKST